MKEKVKHLCKVRGITLKELAGKIGIARESLTRALDGNPTLSTIRGIAEALGVPAWELFSDSSDPGNETIYGIVVYKGTTYRITSMEDLDNLMKLVKKEM